jgi:glycerol-3-phosphate dehydrogenase
MFGADLSEAEVRYLARHEWAMTAEDVVWRRTKLGLRMSKAEVADVDAYLRALQASPQTVA